MNIKIAILPILIITSACTTTANLYPIEGPLSKQTPLPVIIATVDGITGNTGNFIFQNTNGSECTGKWSSIAPQMHSSSWGSLFNAYGSASGSFTTHTNVPGINKGQAYAICNDGVKFDIEFVTGSGTANGTGIAKDTQKNVYKMIF